MEPSSRIRVWLAGALLLGGLAWIYAAVGGFDFVLFDDDINLLLNPRIGSLSAEKWVWAWTDTETMRRYLPLGWLGFLGLFHVFGLEPGPYHWVNLGFHALNTLLVFATVRRAMLVLSATNERTRRIYDAVGAPDCGASRGALFAAFAAAAWWGWHPLRVETVAWVSGVLYLQAGAWSLVAWWAWLREGRDTSVAVGRRWRLLSVAAHGCSLLCYPVALAFPVVVTGWEWLAGRRDMRLLVRRTALLYLLSGACLLMTLLARWQASGIWSSGSSPGDSLSPGRLLAQVYSLFSYMVRPLWPAGLSPVYDSLYSPSVRDPRLWCGAVALVLALVGSLLAGRRWPWLPVVFACLLLSLVPHLGWFETVAYPSDRYLYLLGAWSAPVVAFLLWHVCRRRGRWVWLSAAALAVVAVGVMASLARSQTAVWRDSGSLFARIVEVVRAPELKGFYLARFSVVETMLGRMEESGRLAAQARAVAPGFGPVESELARNHPMQVHAEFGLSPLSRTHHNIAVGHGKAGDVRAMEHHLRRAVQLSPKAWRARYDLALLLAYTGRFDEARSLYSPIPDSVLSSAERARFEGACPLR